MQKRGAKGIRVTLDFLVTAFLGCSAGSAMLLVLFVLIIGFCISEAVLKFKSLSEMLAEAAVGTFMKVMM